MALVFYTRQYTLLDRYEMERTALSLARDGVLGNPYLLPTGPSAHVCPGYAVFLAAVFWLFGTGIKGEIIKQTLASIASSLQYALLPAMAPRFGLSRVIGALAGVAGALLPIKLETETLGDWEAPYVALMLILLVWRMRWSWSRASLSIREGVLQGAGWGFALLWSSSLLPVFVGLFAMGALNFSKTRLVAYARFAIAASLAAFFVLLPWGIRNNRKLGRFILTRSNFGLELNLSNNPLSSPLELENKSLGLYRRFHPLQNRSESVLVQNIGEVRYNQEKFRESVVWIESNPYRFAKLTADRVWFFWFPPNDPPIKAWLLAALSILTVPGLVVLWSRDRWSARMFGSILLLFPLIYYGLQVSVRYKYPIDWLSLLLATNITAWCAGKALNQHPRRPVWKGPSGSKLKQ
jgi:hypothetical protein